MVFYVLYIRISVNVRLGKYGAPSEHSAIEPDRGTEVLRSIPEEGQSCEDQPMGGWVGHAWEVSRNTALRCRECIWVSRGVRISGKS